MRRFAAISLTAALFAAVTVPALGATTEPGPCPVTFTKSDPPVDQNQEWGTATVHDNSVTFLVAAGYTIEVCVKGGPDHTLETIVGVMNHTVYTPINPSNDKPYGLSHYGWRLTQTPPTTTEPPDTVPPDTVPEPTTTTEVPPSTTTTTPPTTDPTTPSTTTPTTVPESTTTTAPPVASTSPTTTVPSPPSTLVPPVIVDPPPVVFTPTTAPPPPVTSTTAPPSTSPPPTLSELPHTGISTAAMSWSALAALVAGGALSWLTRKNEDA